MIVFTADLHLSPTTWVKYPDLQGDSYYSFRQIVDYCTKPENNVSALILGGDIFDKPNPDSLSVQEFIKGVNIVSREREVWANQGQHGRANPPWPALADNVMQLDDGKPTEVSLISGNLRVLGIDNTSASRLKEILSQEPSEPYEILVVHQALRGAVYGDNWNFDKEWVPDHVKLVLMGDIHRTMSDGIFHYPGSISMRSTDENPQKSFIVVDEDDFSVTRVPLVTRDFFKFTITDKESLDEALQVVGEYDRGDKDPIIAKPMVVAKISPEVIDALPKLEEATRDLDMFLYPMDLRVARDEKDKKKIQVATISMDSLVDERLDVIDFETPEERSDQRDFVVRLLRAKDPVDELTVIKTELGVTVEASG